jgi:hypothetical protein
MEIFLPLMVASASARGAGASFCAAGVAGAFGASGALEFCACDEQAQQSNNNNGNKVRVFI